MKINIVFILMKSKEKIKDSFHIIEKNKDLFLELTKTLYEKLENWKKLKPEA